MRRRYVGCAMAMMALCLVGMGARAEDATWSVAGRQVLKIRATVGKMAPAQRVELLDERMTEILSSGDGTLGAAQIVLKKEKGTVSIQVRGRLLITVTKEDAAANRTTREKLGQTWLANMRKTLPQLAPRENRGGA